MRRVQGGHIAGGRAQHHEVRRLGGQRGREQRGRVAGDDNDTPMLQQRASGEQCRRGGKPVAHRAERGQQRLSIAREPRLAGEQMQGRQHLRHHAVAGGRCVVGGGAWAQQRHVGRVARGHRIAVAIAKPFIGGGDQRAGAVEPGGIAGRLKQQQRRTRHRRLIIEHAGGGDAPATLAGPRARHPGMRHAPAGLGHVVVDTS